MVLPGASLWIRLYRVTHSFVKTLTRGVVGGIMVNGLTTMTTTTTQPRYSKRVAEQREQVKKLHTGGASVIQIARATGVTRSAVYQMLKTLDLPSPTERDAS